MGKYASRRKMSHQTCKWDWHRNDFTKGQSLHASLSSHGLLTSASKTGISIQEEEPQLGEERRGEKRDRAKCIFQPSATFK